MRLLCPDLESTPREPGKNEAEWQKARQKVMGKDGPDEATKRAEALPVTKQPELIVRGLGTAAVDGHGCRRRRRCHRLSSLKSMFMRVGMRRRRCKGLFGKGCLLRKAQQGGQQCVCVCLIDGFIRAWVRLDSGMMTSRL